MQAYTTVFDISQKGFDWWFPAFGLIFVVLGPIIVRKHKASNKWAFFFVIFASLWSLISFSSMYPRYRYLQRAYQTHQYLLVEGPVEAFNPMPWGGHHDECFSVQRVRFCYSDYGPTPGFNNTSSHGGPIRAGLPVRVSYLGNSILRLDIRSDSAPSLVEIRKRKIDATETNLIFFLSLPAIALVANGAMWLYDKWREGLKRKSVV
jgi:hypothetical protein